MEKHRLESYKKRLLQQREDLAALVSRTEQDGRSTDEEGTQDLADKAANAYTKEFLFHQSSSERSVLQLIDEALARVASGRYGDCLLCGRAMEQRRLEAVPWARHCIPCQQSEDRDGGSGGGESSRVVA